MYKIYLISPRDKNLWPFWRRRYWRLTVEQEAKGGVVDKSLRSLRSGSD
jgi:hypothetical protein